MDIIRKMINAQSMTVISQMLKQQRGETLTALKRGLFVRQNVSIRTVPAEICPPAGTSVKRQLQSSPKVGMCQREPSPMTRVRIPSKVGMCQREPSLMTEAYRARISGLCMLLAERKGFEPLPGANQLPVFKTGPFNHLGISPYSIRTTAV